MTITTVSDYRIWVGSMGAYNNGTLLGEWIDAEDASWKVDELVAKWHKANPIVNGDEWFIGDHEGFGDAWPGGENPDLLQLGALAEALEEHGEPFAEFAGNGSYGNDTADNVEAFEEAYQGEWDSMEDFACDHADGCGLLAQMPESIRCYFDHAAYARDLEGGYWTARTASGGVYVYLSL